MIRKNIKVITIFMLGTISAIGFVFAYQASSKNIRFIKEGWNVKTVDDAVSYLKDSTKCEGLAYKKIGTLKTAAHDKTPDMYEIDPGDGIKRNFYVLEDKGDTLDLIMDRNITTTSIGYNNAKTYFETNGYKTNWKDVIDVKLPTANQLAGKGDIPNFDSSTRSCSNYSFFGVNSTSDSSYRTNYIWLYDYLNGCSSAGCYNDTKTGSSGYWASEECMNDTTRAWMVYSPGRLTSDPKANGYGVRPVITVNKNNLQ